MAIKSTDGYVKMPRREFSSEHKNLVKILKSGTKKEQRREAREQASEFAGVRKKHGK